MDLPSAKLLHQNRKQIARKRTTHHHNSHRRSLCSNAATVVTALIVTAAKQQQQHINLIIYHNPNINSVRIIKLSKKEL